MKYGWNVAGSNKKIIEAEKNRKNTYFLFRALFVHFLVNRLIFGYHKYGAVVAAVNLI